MPAPKKVKKAIVEFDEDVQDLLDIMIQRKKSIMRKENHGLVPCGRKEIICEIINEMMRIYGGDYILRLDRINDEMDKQRGRMPSSEIIRKLLFGK